MKPPGTTTGVGGAGATAAPAGDGPSGNVRALHLAVGDVLILEEVVGPGTGNRADADPGRRHAVRLTKVTLSVDPLYHPYDPKFGQPVVEIEWCPEDALPFALCISARMPAPDCSIRTDISVARGNVILVSHGASTIEKPRWAQCPRIPRSNGVPAAASPPTRRLCPTRNATDPPYQFAVVARVLIAQDPRQALPQVSLTGTQTTAFGDVVTTWTPKADLLESGPEDTSFVVEMDDDGNAHLRFGDGYLGRMPDAGTVFDAAYRLGNGAAGNVGAETITCIVFRQTVGNPGKLEPRNPLAASGGTDPEPVEEVKQFAPGAFHTVLERAITADDYAALASDNARRLAERLALIRQALAAPQPQPQLPGAPIDRAGEEEDAGDEPTNGPKICSAPFVRLQRAKARLRWTGKAGTKSSSPWTRWARKLPMTRRSPRSAPTWSATGASATTSQFSRPNTSASISTCMSACCRNTCAGTWSRRFSISKEQSRAAGRHQGHVPSRQPDVRRQHLREPHHRGGPGGDRRAGRRGDVETRASFEIGEPPLGTENVGEEVPAGSVMEFGPFEIPRLDNDPNYPENGRLTLDLGGGR